MNISLSINSKSSKKNCLFLGFLSRLTITIVLAGCFSEQGVASCDFTKVEEQRDVNVLSLEGGGCRAVIELTFLSELEKEANLPIAKIFDVIAGTSIGATVATALTLPSTEMPENPRFTATELLNEFERQLPNIFQSQFSLSGLWGPRYSSRGMQQVAAGFFSNVTFDKALSHVIVPAFDLNTSQTVIFKSWKSSRNCFYTADIARGSGAAPTYFNPHVMYSTSGSPLVTYRLIDGGIAANVPAQIAVIEAEKLFGRSQHHQIVSLYTGDLGVTYPVEKYEKAGLITWGLSLLDLFIKGQETLTDYGLRYQYGRCYSHWNPQIMIEGAKLDNYAPEVLTYYSQVTFEMIENRREEFEALVQRLLKNIK